MAESTDPILPEKSALALVLIHLRFERILRTNGVQMRSSRKSYLKRRKLKQRILRQFLGKVLRYIHCYIAVLELERGHFEG